MTSVGAVKKALVPPNSSRVHLRRSVEALASSLVSGSRVLDAGAGEAPFRALFSHVEYETADFAQVEKAYGQIDYVCDLSKIPVPDERYDAVLCTQVFEHLPAPAEVLKELRRVTKADGKIFLTAPLFFEEHEKPFDFHRYTQFAWRRMAEEAKLTVEELEWLEGYYGTLSYQMKMAAISLPGFRWLPVRGLFLGFSHLFARLDIRHRVVGKGMPKNYRCVMVKRQ